MNYTVFDVETANERRDSVCAMGIIRYENNQIVYEKEILINPETEFNYFNIKVHGITESDVSCAPTFPEIWDEIKVYFDQTILVAHNAKSMDLCALYRTLERYGLPEVRNDYICTMELAKMIFKENEAVSSYRLDEPERGFTYREDVPLDMRMDRRNPKTAKNIVNEYSEMDLFRIIRDYGEDKFAKNIAKHIVAAREKKEIETTGELIEIIKAAIPAKVRATGGHPAKKTFQAIRIELNEELEVLQNSLDEMIDLLEDGGRICIITFHSLEDRIVKTIYKTNENPCTCPSHFPVCVCGKKPKGKVITRKPIVPSDEELEYNSRAKSSKLRVFERIRED
mgnify:CR=1 FL=1